MIRKWTIERGARFYIDGVQLNENKLTYIRKEEHAKLIIFYFTKYLQLEEQQTTNLLKFNIKTNEIIFRPANSLELIEAGEGKTYLQYEVLVHGLNSNIQYHK